MKIKFFKSSLLYCDFKKQESKLMILLITRITRKKVMYCSHGGATVNAIKTSFVGFPMPLHLPFFHFLLLSSAARCIRSVPDAHTHMHTMASNTLCIHRHTAMTHMHMICLCVVDLRLT